jgi:hypothetical protein
MNDALAPAIVVDDMTKRFRIFIDLPHEVAIDRGTIDHPPTEVAG